MASAAADVNRWPSPRARAAFWTTDQLAAFCAADVQFSRPCSGKEVVVVVVVVIGPPPLARLAQGAVRARISPNRRPLAKSLSDWWRVDWGEEDACC